MGNSYHKLCLPGEKGGAWRGALLLALQKSPSPFPQGWANGD